MQLRLEGLSRSQIAVALGLGGGGEPLSTWLKGVPVPEWTRRPNAKDDLRERAVAMRKDGRSYREIQAVVGVAKSTLSLWLCDVPLTEDQQRVLAMRTPAAASRRAQAIRASAAQRRLRMHEEARAQVTGLCESELFVAGVVAYWAEGSKNKPWRSGQAVVFINSDPRPHPALPSVAGADRHRAGPAAVPTDDPRIGRRLRVTRTLVRRGRGTSGVVRTRAAEDPQPEDRPQKCRRGLPRLPRDLRSPER